MPNSSIECIDAIRGLAASPGGPMPAMPPALASSGARMRSAVLTENEMTIAIMPMVQRIAGPVLTCGPRAVGGGLREARGP